MDADEIKKRLLEMGIPVGGWGDSKPGAKPITPTLVRQRDALEKVKDLLQQQLDQQIEKRAALQETLMRLKHGGGQ